MAVKFKLSDEEKEKANKLLKIMEADKEEASSTPSKKEQHSISQTISLPTAKDKAQTKLLPTYRQNISTKMDRLPTATLSNDKVNKYETNTGLSLLTKGFLGDKIKDKIDSGEIELFKKPKEFEDGYEDNSNIATRGALGKAGDVILGTGADIVGKLGAGMISPIENVVDVGANIFASGLSSGSGALGIKNEKSAENIRNFANADISGRLGDIISNVNPFGVAYNIAKGTPNKIFNPAEIAIDFNKNPIENYKEGFNKAYIVDKDEEETSKSSILGDTSQQGVRMIGYSLGNVILGQNSTDMTGTAKLGKISASGGNIGLQIGKHTLNLPTLSIAGGMAGGLEEANSTENVTEAQRWTKAILGGITEGFSEGMFGFLGVGGNDVTDSLKGKLAEQFSSKAGKMLANLGVEMTGEATEEIVSYLLNWFTDNAVVNNIGDGDFSKEFNLEEMLGEAIMAMVTTGISGGANITINTNSSVKEVESQIGRKLSQQEKIGVTQAVIDGTLYERLQNNTSFKNDNNINSNLQQNRYSNKNYEESAKRYGIDTSNETVKSINRVAQDRGINVIYNADLFNDTNTNAIWRNNADGTREIILNPNADTNKTLQNVITHELTHDLEGTTEYNELRDLILNYNENKTDYAEARKSLEELYSKVYDRNSTEFETLVDNEVVADILGNKLGNQEFVNNLTTQKPTLGKRIYNWVVDKLNKLNKLTGYKSEKIFWKDVKNKFENAYKQENSNNDSKDLYSIAGKKGMQNLVKSSPSNNITLEQLYNRAKQLQRNGLSNEEIRQQTNWFQDKNGDWKFEFSDKNMTLKNNIKLETGKKYKLGDILEHDTLFTAYPELINYSVELNKSLKVNGSFDNKDKVIKINSELVKNQKRLEGTLIHEIQHAIQHIENFESGSSSRKSKLAYYNSLGEIEASDTKSRFLNEKYKNKDIYNIAPESSKLQPQHKDLNNYLKNRNLLDKVKDSVYNYFNINNKIGKKNHEYDIKKDYTENKSKNNYEKLEEIKKKSIRKEYGIENENSNKSSFSMQESENNSWQSYLNKNYKNTGTGQTIQEVKKAPTASDNVLETGEYTEKQKGKILNPAEISNLKQEDANTTPKLKNKNYEKGNKKSNFFSNITEKSKFLNEDFRNVMKQDENIEYYKTVSNKETLEKAYNKLQEDGETEVIKWHSKDSEKATTHDVAEGWILLKQYQDAGDYESAVEVAKKMREIGTKAGQTVQAYNILSRLTPEGMFYYAQSELSEAYSKMVEGKSKKWIDENKSKFDLTPEETKFIMDTMQDVSKMPDGYNKKVKLAEIQKVITDKIPATAGQSIKAWMRISMLFNPKTQVRNVMGNAVIMPVNMFSDSVSAGIDKIISKKTGIRTTGNTNIKNYAKGFGKGLYESYNDFKKGINTRNIQGNRFEVSEGKNFNNKVLGKALNRVDNLLSFMLDAGDRGFYEATFTNSINNQLVLNNTTEVTQEMIDIATTEALQRTWQDNNAYTQAVLKIRNILNGKIGKNKGINYGIGDVLIPFAKTPANLTKAIVDYSPVGLVKTLTSDAIKLKNSLENGQYTPQLQHRFVQNLGKATAGSFLYVLGYALAQAGVITGEADEDKDIKNFMKNSLGISSYSIKIGDKSFTYDWAQPIAAPFAFMANFTQKQKDNPEMNLFDTIGTVINTGTDLLFEQSFMESINTVLNGSGSVWENFVQSVLELPSRAIPTFSKQIADMVDSTQRTSFEYDKPIQSAINSVIAKIPVASKQLPASVDTLGNEIQKYGGENNLFNIFLNPANMNKGQLSKAGEEIYNIYKETGDTTIFPRTAPYYINNKGEKITMTSEERSNFQKISGTYVEDTLEGMLKNDYYKKLSNEEKAELINQIVSDSYSKAKYDVLKIDSKEYEKLRETLKNIKTTTYYDYKSKTKNMKTDKEKIGVLVDSNYSNKEKQALYENYVLSSSDTEYPLIKQTFTSNGLNINKYLKYKAQEFTSDKEDDGTLNEKTVSGSKKEKVEKYLNSMDITYMQQLLLYAMNGYSTTSTQKTTLANYINNLKGITYEQRLEVFDKIGFTVYKDGTIEW